MININQQDLETLMVEKGKERFQAKERFARELDTISKTKAGIDMIKRAIYPFSQEINRWKVESASGKPTGRASAYKFLKDIDTDMIAYLASTVILDHAMTRATVNSASIAIATAIEDEVRLAVFNRTNPALFATVKRRIAQNMHGHRNARAVYLYSARKFDVEIPTWGKLEKMKIGSLLIDLFIKSVGAVKSVHHVAGHNKTMIVLSPTDYMEEWLKDRTAQAEIMRPYYLPMVVLPKPWDSVYGGGYVSLPRPMPVVKRSYKQQMRELKEADLRVVYNGLNALQETPWRINPRVLEVLSYVWDHDLQIALPNRDDIPLPPTPDDFDDPDVRKAWKMEARRTYDTNSASRGRRLAIARLISTATDFKDVEAFYYPHQLDFRGRAYAVPPLLNPQSQDEARALLLCADGKPVGNERAADWLRIHGANLYGFDKVSMEERIQWAKDNDELIRLTANDPLTHKWWADADKPWCFLAWCFEYAGFLEEGYSFITSLPVSVDGSCNGLQHFSAMLRDPVGGAAVNLIPSDKPQDIYGRVAERTIARLKDQITDPETGWICASWVQFGIDRKITKRPVMVLPYGGTYNSCLQYVRESVNAKIATTGNDPFGPEIGKATVVLASAIWRAIGDVVVAAKVAMGWLQQCSRVVSKANTPLSWVTPSGFVAHQNYVDVKRKKITTELSGSIVQLSWVEDTDKIDKNKQALAVSPNFVHSLDASAMMLTIDIAVRDFGIRHFAMIHDSYGTLAPDMDALAGALRYAFVNMYETHDVLAEFRQECVDTLTKCERLDLIEELPPVPETGDLDLHRVYESEFFFA